MNHNENKEIEQLQDPEEDFFHHKLCPNAWAWDNKRVKCDCAKKYKKKHNGRETPGGDSAIDKGCTCPVLDNHHGLGIGNGNFWMNADCPVHGKKSPI